MSDLIDLDRRRLLGAGAMAVAGARLGLYNPVTAAVDAAAHPAARGELASLRTATAWLNSPALTAADLQGKVVVIDVWTYTCINWLRTRPYAHGDDVDDQGYGTVTGQRLYQLIRQPKPIVDRQFTIEFLGAGVEAFAFTFG